MRTATLKDLDTLVRFRRRMFEDMGVRDGLDAADRVYRRWAARLLNRGELVGWIAERGGRAVAGGCVWLRPQQPRPGAKRDVQPYLLSVYTEPEFRGRGLASRVAKAAIDWCRRSGFPGLVLHASSMGRRVYAKLGWRRTWEMKLELA
jgi:GNAT superfamily N-acetyltransferase